MAGSAGRQRGRGVTRAPLAGLQLYDNLGYRGLIVADFAARYLGSLAPSPDLAPHVAMDKILTFTASVR